MNFKKIIKKIFSLKIPLIRSKNIKPYWAFKLSVNQVSLIFDASYRGCFGLLKSFRYNQFLKEYNKLFNNSEGTKFLDSSVLKLKIQNKAYNILPALYYDLITVCSDLGKLTFLEYFGEEFTNVKQLERILKRISFLEEKLTAIQQPESKQKDGILFTELVNMIETSRALPIDRNIKLYQFKAMYDTEIKKWQN